MSSTVPEIASALATAIETIDGLRTAPYLRDNISPPIALVAWNKATYHGAFGYSDTENEFFIFLIIGRASEQAGIEATEGYVSNDGAMSIRAAVEADPTLGGVVAAATVTESGPPTSIQIGQSGAIYLSCPFTVETHS